MRYFKLLLLAMVAAGPSPASAQELRSVTNPEQLGFSAARLQRMTDTYQGYVDRGELPGAVLLIARGEKIAYLQAIGYQDREKKITMKKDAIFRLASMTKPIVSVAAMTLAEEAKLDLDAPEATQGFLLNHAICEALPADGSGRSRSNADPITGQAAWFDLRVRLQKCAAGDACETAPQFAPLANPPGSSPNPRWLSFGAQFRRGREQTR